MNTPILEISNVSKQYRLGYVGTGTMSDDLWRWWYRVRGKEDPYLKIGEENDRTQVGDSEYVWALRDINLQVQQGEVLGIIGANGAGKSTLLKILSRVTGPTIGTITARGRIASLLEVGTGFHGELTGRENIFLNGAILGMTKREIQSKFDEIVDFAGCQRYIDTPVKRYSSGMYVRLAFAVAAHLEPEILIVDEVLAVGDAEFQKKAIGKMKDISSGQGRTVLFVSHNMDSIEQLCSKAIYLSNGQLVSYGNTSDIIHEYLSCNNPQQLSLESPKRRSGNRNIEYISVNTYNSDEIQTNTFHSNDSIIVKTKLKINDVNTYSDIVVGIGIENIIGKRVFTGTTSWLQKSFSITKDSSYITAVFKIDNLPVIKGDYTITLIISNGILTIDHIEQCHVITIKDDDASYALGRNREQGDLKLDYDIDLEIS